MSGRREPEPLLDDLRKWMEKALRSLSAKSETAGAIRYALSRWRALTRYTEDGMLEIDNSAAERALRAVALGRKNYLFAGSDCGGERAAAMYSLIGSAKLNGLDPELYLRTVLAQIADHPISRIEELLPWNLAPSITDSNPHRPLRHTHQVPTKKVVGTSRMTRRDRSRGETRDAYPNRHRLSLQSRKVCNCYGNDVPIGISFSTNSSTPFYF